MEHWMTKGLPFLEEHVKHCRISDMCDKQYKKLEVNIVEVIGSIEELEPNDIMPANVWSIINFVILKEARLNKQIQEKVYSKKET